MNATRRSPFRRSPWFDSKRARLQILARPRLGMSLLEVMLAIAILGGAMVVLSELVRMGSRSAREARELTVAQLLCEAKLAEVALGFAPAQTASQQPCETDDNWVYSIDVQEGDQAGLMIVMVRVSEAQPVGPRPLEFTLTRLMADPSLDQASMSSDTSTTDASSTAQPASDGGATSGGTTGSTGASGS